MIVLGRLVPAWLAAFGSVAVLAQAGVGPASPTMVQTLEAYDRVAGWVRVLTVPETALAPSAEGACVTLRRDGRVVGRGVAIGLGPETVAQAARLAIDDARGALLNPVTSSEPEAIALIASGLTVSVELAGAPVPIDAGTYNEITAGLLPGIDAVAVRLGAQTAAVFPLEMLATRQQAGRAASRLIGSLAGDAVTGLRQPAELIEGAGAGFFRLRTRAVSQLTPGSRPELLARGGRVVELADVRIDRIRSQIESTAVHMLARHDAGLYLPMNDRSLEPPSDAARALAALAVQSAADQGLLDREQEREARLFVRRAITNISSDKPVDAAARAIAAVIAERAGDGTGSTALLAPLLEAGGTEAARSAPIVAWAFAELGHAVQAQDVLSRIRRVEHPGQLVSVMPWAGWASQRLGTEAEVSGGVALRQMREIVHGFQLTPADAGQENRDLVGGVVFTSGPVPLPTWQSARPWAFLASMLSDPRLTNQAERDAAVAHSIRAARFLIQLSAGEAEGHLYRDPQRAEGGVRAAVWDHAMPLEASAMVLLALVELEASLRVLVEDDEPPATAGAGG